MKFFLDHKRIEEWGQVQKFASQDNPAADRKIREYVLEAQRLTSSQRNLRICKRTTVVDGKTYQPGDALVCLFVSALLFLVLYFLSLVSLRTKKR